MKSRRSIVKAFLIVMGLTLTLTSCGSSKKTINPETDSKVNKPTTESQPKVDKPNPSTIDLAKLLTPQDVETVTGLKGVKTVPYNPQIGAGGKLNFALGDESLVLAVMVEDKSMFESWKTNKNLNSEAVSNLGDEAFRGVKDNAMYTPNVTFLKRGNSIQLFTFFNLNNDMKPYLSHEKLIELGKIIEGRM